RTLQACDFLSQRVEHAALLPDAREPGFGIGVPGVAEHPLEDGARIVLSKERRVRALPRNRVRVLACKTDVACPGGVAIFDGQLERSELCMLAGLLSQDLIDRNPGVKPRFAGRR